MQFVLEQIVTPSKEYDAAFVTISIIDFPA